MTVTIPSSSFRIDRLSLHGPDHARNRLDNMCGFIWHFNCEEPAEPADYSGATRPHTINICRHVNYYIGHHRYHHIHLAHGSYDFSMFSMVYF